MKNITLTFFKNNEKGDRTCNEVFTLQPLVDNKFSLTFNAVDINNMYDDKGNLIRQTSIRPDGTIIRGTKMQYNSEGKLIETNFKDIDLIVRYKYDENGNCIDKYDNYGHYDNYEYDAKGRIVKSLNEDGLIITYEYDEENNIQKIIYPEGIVYKHQYDKDGLLIYVESNGEILSKNIYIEGIVISITNISIKVDIDINKYKDLHTVLKNIFSDECENNIHLRFIKNNDKEDPIYSRIINITCYEYKFNNLEYDDRDNVIKRYGYLENIFEFECDSNNKIVTEKSDDKIIFRYEYLDSITIQKATNLSTEYQIDIDKYQWLFDLLFVD